MDLEISKIIFKEKPTLSEMSIKTYSNCISKMMELIKETNFNILYTDANKIIKMLKEKYEKNNTIKTKIASVIVFLRCIKNDKNKEDIDKAIEIYSKIVDILTNNIKTDLSSSEKNTKQKENWINEEDNVKLDKMLFELIPAKIKTPKDLMKLRNYVIFKFYETNPTRNELAESKIIFLPNKKQVLSDEYNYIILDKKNKTITYKMNQYKTSKNYGQKNIDINKDLFPLFLHYKKAVDLFNNNNWFLLNDSASDKLTPNRLGVIYGELGKGINKKLGTSMNRHIQLSNLIPVKKIKEMTDKMGNSPKEALEVYAKN